MSISVVDLFSIGIGPSSSHTVGPMRAAKAFVDSLSEYPARVTVTLRGSLASTGVGHGTDRATLLGLVGWTPTTVPVNAHPELGEPILTDSTFSGPLGTVDYSLIFDPEPAAEHPNAMTFDAYDADGNVLAQGKNYFSVGGGFVLSSEDYQRQRDYHHRLPAGVATARADEDDLSRIPYPFDTGEELLDLCVQHNLRIPQIMLANEAAMHAEEGGEDFVNAHLDAVWETMQQCVDRGMRSEGVLPGVLQVNRRAKKLRTALVTRDLAISDEGLTAMEWVNLYALAVNEENAAGGQIVTAPTNGAAGIIPAVMHYARDFLSVFDQQSARDFLLAAGAVGVIIKTNASISGAEVGCQGEVGSAAAMAAAGLAEVHNCTPSAVEHAAEIALEHNLGLTCDPVGGLVQIPCIERNAIGAVKAINAARLSRIGSETVHYVSLDDAVRVMAETGRDMLNKYKETSTGGLATALGMPVPVNVTAC